MIIFTGTGLALIAASIRYSEGEFRNPFMPLKKKEMPVSQTFQIWLFGVASLVLTVNFALNYTMQSQAAIQNANEDLAVASKDISDRLYTGGIPDPDLIIRTGGEMRLSNFLLYQSAYSEYYSTDTLWPDFHEEDFDKAIIEFNRRNRRFGGV